MKRWVILGALVVALTAAGTVLLPMLPTESEVAGGIDYPVPAKDSPDRPKAVISSGGDPAHNFGTMAQEATGEKTWTIKNEGKGDLLLKKGPSTCSCTIVNFKDKDEATLKPGESTDIRLTWETRKNDGKYSKGASVLTNDPDHLKLDFTVEGTVRPAVLLYPPSTTIDYGTRTNDLDDHPYKVALTSPDKPGLKITKVTTSKPGLIEAEHQPLTEQECKSLKVEAGHRVTIHARGGLPLGAFREEVVLETDHPLQPELRLTVTGKMTGPIAVLPERLRMLDVPGTRGGQESVKLLVRGNKSTHFEIEKKPENLKVEIAPIDNPPKDGKYQMIVTVPPGTPAGTIEDQIILKTDHPKAGELKIPVQVYVGNSG